MSSVSGDMLLNGFGADLLPALNTQCSSLLDIGFACFRPVPVDAGTSKMPNGEPALQVMAHTPLQRLVPLLRAGLLQSTRATPEGMMLNNFWK